MKETNDNFFQQTDKFELTEAAEFEEHKRFDTVDISVNVADGSQAAAGYQTNNTQGYNSLQKALKGVVMSPPLDRRFIQSDFRREGGEMND